MSSNMLGIAPEDICGPMIDLLQKFKGPNREIWLKEFKSFLRKEKNWSTVVKVDRTQPFLPKVIMDNIGSCGPKEALLLHPEYENFGPTEFNMSEISFLISTPKPEEEKKGNKLYTLNFGGERCYVALGGLYEYLTNHPLFIKNNSLGLRDAEAMIKCFEYIPSKLKSLERLPLWKGVARRVSDGGLYLPYLILRGDEGNIYWRSLSLGEPAQELGHLIPCYPKTKEEVL